MSRTLKHIKPQVPPGPACVVRLADLEDPDDCARLRDLLQEYASDLLGSPGGLGEDILRVAIPGLARIPGAFALLAFVDDEPAGMANCLPSYSTFRAQPVINVHDLAVRRTFRSRGIGDALLHRVEREADARGCCKVTLEVQADNERARRLYHRRGYRGAPGQSDGPGTFFLELGLPDETEESGNRT